MRQHLGRLMRVSGFYQVRRAFATAETTAGAASGGRVKKFIVRTSTLVLLGGSLGGGYIIYRPDSYLSRLADQYSPWPIPRQTLYPVVNWIVVKSKLGGSKILEWLGWKLGGEKVEQKGLGLVSKIEDKKPRLVDLSEVTENMAGKAELAVQLAESSVKSYAAKLKSALSATGKEEVSGKSELEDLWNSVVESAEVQTTNVNLAESALSSAVEQLQNFQSEINKTESREGSVGTIYTQIEPAKKSLKEFRERVEKSTASLKACLEENATFTRYDAYIKAARDNFRRELKSILPSRWGGKLTPEELDIMLAHAHRRLEQLQERTVRERILAEKALADALEKQKAVLTEEKTTSIQEAIQQTKDDEKLLRRQQELQIQNYFAEELERARAELTSAHVDHMNAMLKVQKEDFQARLAKDLKEKVILERMSWHEELRTWIARLHGIEKAVQDRAGQDKQARSAQQLWLASLNLASTLKGSDGGGSSAESHKLLDIRPHILSIRTAGGDHPLVRSLLQEIPSEAAEHGVYSERFLRKRFEKMKRAAMRVNSVEQYGSSIGWWILSAFDSILQRESALRLDSEDGSIDTSKLDTFHLLVSAKYALEADDWADAIRYVNALQGMPREVAKDWLKDARLYATTRQVADVLMAHASANTLGMLV